MTTALESIGLFAFSAFVLWYGMKKTVELCGFSGHKFNDHRNVFICEKCGLMKPKVRK